MRSDRAFLNPIEDDARVFEFRRVHRPYDNPRELKKREADLFETVSSIIYTQCMQLEIETTITELESA
jgi:hypothetical protein